MKGFNLLPWREELREQQKKQFLQFITLAILGCLVVILLVHSFISYRISSQENINHYLQNEITLLDKKIAEVKDLQTQKQKMIERRDIIRRLQVNRTEVVYLYDSLVRVLPPGVYISSVKRKGNKVFIVGKAESSTRISDFMRSINHSKWLKEANLDEIKVDEKDLVFNQNFQLQFVQRTDSADEKIITRK